MGVIRNFLFRMVYPLPQKGDDLLSYKEKFIKDYVEPYEVWLEIKSAIMPSKECESVPYAKNKHDKLQRKHAEAYEIFQKIAYMKQKIR